MSKRLFLNSKMMITELGGLAISLINKTGTTSVKGMLVEPDGGVDSAFDIVPVDGVDCIGVVYGDDEGSQVADAVACWVVIAGIAQVLFESATTREHMARMGVAADGNDTAGYAMSEAVPTSPFSIDKHFAEIGHVIESIGGSGLAKCVLHFN